MHSEKDERITHLEEENRNLMRRIEKLQEIISNQDKVIIAERYRSNKYAKQRESLFERIEKLENSPERIRWLEHQQLKYKVDKIGRLPHSNQMYIESINCYINGLFFATILCTEAAVGSLLMQKLNKPPMLRSKKRKGRKGSDYRVPSTRELIKESFSKKIINLDLKKELLEFLETRRKVEHPTDQSESLMLKWKYEGGESGHLRSIDTENLSESQYTDILPVDHSKEFAQKGLTFYFKLSESILKWIEKGTST